jgi:hypothetical protein
VKLDALRPSSPPKASCQQSFRLDLPHAGGISEGPVVSVSSDWHGFALMVRRLAPRVARLVADFATRGNACMHVGVGYALLDRPR